MAQRLQIQIGIQAEGLRLTPIDQVLPDLPDGVETLIAGLVLRAEGHDRQPGNGDLDLPVDDSLRKLLGNVAPVASLLPAGAEAFVRVKLVQD